MQASSVRSSSDLRLWAVIVLLAGLLFAGRLATFGELEPRHDQGYFASTVRDLLAADHVIPHRKPGESFGAALQTDQKSILHAIGRPLYANPLFALLLVPFFIWSLLLTPFGYSYQHLVALSISLSVLNLLPLTLLFRRVTGLSGFSASAAAVVYAASAYAWLFSGWGYHNMALNTFLWAALAGSFLRLDFPEATPTWAQLAGRLWPVTVATLVAAYSQQINVLLVPAGIAVYILVLPDVPGPVRIRAVVLYASAVVAGLAPVGLFASALHRVQRDFTSYANAGTSAGAYLTGLAERAGSWFLCARQIFSLPGTLAGAVGVGLLAWRRARLPLVFLGVHFAAYCLIPGLTWAGGHTYLRTWNYVIPTLATGIAFLFVELFGKLPGSPLRWAATTLLGLLLALHLRDQWPEQGFESWAKNRLGDFESTYLVGQGELRPIIHQMEARIQGAPILFWGLPEKYAFMALANSSEGVGLSVLTSDGMYSRNTRPTDFGPDGTRLEYVVASNEAGASDPFSAEALESALRRLYHSQPELQALGEYPVHSAWCRTLILYSARIHRPDSPEAAR